MDSIELINIIKKMLADNLTTSEREQLLDEKPMINFQSQQWKKAPLWLNAGVKNSLY